MLGFTVTEVHSRPQASHTSATPSVLALPQQLRPSRFPAPGVIGSVAGPQAATPVSATTWTRRSAPPHLHFGSSEMAPRLALRLRGSSPSSPRRAGHLSA
eukprot:scaffold45306_cov270-Isochrysis_galbana.AAC.3